MVAAVLDIDLGALVANWRALGRLAGPGVVNGAVVKADAYGLGAGPVAVALARAGAREFFVAIAEEGAAVRQALGPGPRISVFAGHMAGDAGLLASAGLTPMLNSPEQFARHREALPAHEYGLQLDSGMARLGIMGTDWPGLREAALAGPAVMLMSHLACADEPGHPMNKAQLAAFRAMTEGSTLPRSLSATGGILLGSDYHFDILRPGIGLFGAEAFAGSAPVAHLSLPVIQIRDVAKGEPVGYGCAWRAPRPSRIAVVSAGYADGIFRAMGAKLRLWAGDRPCPLAGRVSMDMLSVDVTDLAEAPEWLDLLGPHQTVSDLAAMAGTISYEVLTALGARYARHYREDRK